MVASLLPRPCLLPLSLSLPSFQIQRRSELDGHVPTRPKAKFCLLGLLVKQWITLSARGPVIDGLINSFSFVLRPRFKFIRSDIGWPYVFSGI